MNGSQSKNESHRLSKEVLETGLWTNKERGNPKTE